MPNQPLCHLIKISSLARLRKLQLRASTYLLYSVHSTRSDRPSITFYNGLEMKEASSHQSFLFISIDCRPNQFALSSYGNHHRQGGWSALTTQRHLPSTVASSRLAAQHTWKIAVTALFRQSMLCATYRSLLSLGLPASDFS